MTKKKTNEELVTELSNRIHAATIIIATNLMLADHNLTSFGEAMRQAGNLITDKKEELYP